MKKLDRNSLLSNAKKDLTTQDYSGQTRIKGVEFFDLKNFSADDGSFLELARFTNGGKLEAIPEFKILQINYSLMLPGSIKAWHVHFNQEDVWYIPSEDRLLVGLVDLRKDSPTSNVKMRFVMGGGKSQLLYIPRGVGHGASNMGSNDARVIYFINQKFDPKSPDERRLPWDHFGADFWRYKYE